MKYDRRWYLTNRHKKSYKFRAWMANLTYYYGPKAVDHYIKQSAKQKNRCAICRRPTTKRLGQDHSHKTKKLHGLLCCPCNRLLGQIEKIGVKKWLAYIDKWRIR